VDSLVMLITSTIIGATFGALVMALLSSRSYDRGYEDAANTHVSPRGVSIDFAE
jgi:hypothetical protein